MDYTKGIIKVGKIQKRRENEQKWCTETKSFFFFWPIKYLKKPKDIY